MVPAAGLQTFAPDAPVMHFSAVGTPSTVGSANGSAKAPTAQSEADEVHGFPPPRSPPSSWAWLVPASSVAAQTANMRRDGIVMALDPPRRASALVDSRESSQAASRSRSPEL